MTYKTVEVDVDVCLDEWNDNELIEEMEHRGYTCVKTAETQGFEREDLEYLLNLVDNQPKTWYYYRIRDKLTMLQYD